MGRRKVHEFPGLQSPHYEDVEQAYALAYIDGLEPEAIESFFADAPMPWTRAIVACATALSADDRERACSTIRDLVELAIAKSHGVHWQADLVREASRDD